MIVFGTVDHLQLLTQKKDKGNDFNYVINRFFFNDYKILICYNLLQLCQGNYRFIQTNN